jgi:hypothetical protein
MLKRYSHFFAYLLLVLMPLQSIAAANIAACNSLIQPSHVSEVDAVSMPCHKHMAGTSENASNPSGCYDNHTCKTNCALFYSSLTAMTTLPDCMKITAFSASFSFIGISHQSYISIIQPNLQRPPIYLS